MDTANIKFNRVVAKNNFKFSDMEELKASGREVYPQRNWLDSRRHGKESKGDFDPGRHA